MVNKSTFVQATHVFVVRPSSGGIRFSSKAKKHKANSGKIHIDLEVGASIYLEKGVSLDDGVLGSSQ